MASVCAWSASFWKVERSCADDPVRAALEDINRMINDSSDIDAQFSKTYLELLNNFVSVGDFLSSGLQL